MLLQEDSTVLFSIPNSRVIAKRIEVIPPTPQITHNATFTMLPTNSY